MEQRIIELQKELELRAENHIYHRGDVIYKENEKLEDFYFLKDGIAYTYFTDKHGKEITSIFTMENMHLLNAEDFRNKTMFGARALTDAEVVTFPIRDALELAKAYPEMYGKYIEYLTGAYNYKCVANNMRMNSDALERYQWFCEEWPEVEELASNQQIASFLRIQSGSLSRLRMQCRNMNQKKNNQNRIVLAQDNWK